MLPVVTSSVERKPGHEDPEGETHLADGGSASKELKVLIAHELVVCRWMMLGIIICTICFTRCPIKIGLVLGDSVLEPMIAHVKGF